MSDELTALYHCTNCGSHEEAPRFERPACCFQPMIMGNRNPEEPCRLCEPEDDEE